MYVTQIELHPMQEFTEWNKPEDWKQILTIYN